MHTQEKMTQMPLMNIYYCLGQFILGFITVITFFLYLRLAACAASEVFGGHSWSRALLPA